MLRRLCSVAVLLILLFGTKILGAKASAELGAAALTQEKVCGPVSSARYDSFLRCAADSGILIPGLEQSFVPQGVCYWQEQNAFLISGYFSPQLPAMPSAILLLSGETGRMEGLYCLIDSRGRACTDHFSGLAVTDRFLFVTGNRSLHRLSLEQLRRADSRDTLRVEQTVCIGMGAASCSLSDGLLWVSSHHRHGIGDAQLVPCANMVGFQIREDGTPEPVCAFRVPQKVQGAAVTENGLVVLSLSYGRWYPSDLLFYGDPRSDPPDGTVLLLGKQVPRWDLTVSRSLAQVTAPPMSEGCCVVGDRVYLVFESGCGCYRDGGILSGAKDPLDTLWILDTEKLLP